MYQSEAATEVIVSDNSCDNETTRDITKKYPAVKYVRQSGILTAPQHMAAAASLIKSGYYNILHDDDELGEDYLLEIRAALAIYPHAIAIGTGFIINKNNIEENPNFLFARTERYTEIANRDTFLLGYMSPIYGGMPPFSSYTFDSSSVSWKEINKFLSTQYYDALFLASLISTQHIVFIDKKIFRMGFHKDRISNTCGVRDYKVFYNLVLKELQHRNLRKPLEVYRIRSLLSILFRNRGSRLSRIRFNRILLTCFMLLMRNKVFRQTLYFYLKVRIVEFKIKLFAN